MRAARLRAAEILEAMERGDFYSSTGVELSSYEATAERITIVVKESLMAKYRVQFIGSGGRVLKEVASSTARYDITGSEGYVRARVMDSNGQVAWTQPMVTGGRAR